MKKVALLIVGCFILSLVLSSCDSTSGLRGINKYEGKMWKKKLKQRKATENCW